MKTNDISMSHYGIFVGEPSSHEVIFEAVHCVFKGEVELAVLKNGQLLVYALSSVLQYDTFSIAVVL